MSFAIQTRQLSRHYGAIQAVSKLDLQVPTHSIYGFLGPNGAGKTTTIRLLLGLIRPTHGSIQLNGVDLRADRIAALSGVGALVESPTLYPNLTGMQNLRLTAGILGVEQAQLNELIDWVDLTRSINRQVRQYSLGMRQRLALARAMMGRPRLLILDEPSNGLDPAGMEAMRQIIRELPERFSTTVLLSSHLLGEIEQTATHCGLIRRGEMIFQGRLDALMEQSATTVALEVDPVDRALSHLQSINLPSERCEGGVRILAALTQEQRAELVSELVRLKCRVSGIRQQRASLEQLFLTLTGDPT